jgi:hypothetical protein
MSSPDFNHDQILDLAKEILADRGMGQAIPSVEALRPHGVLPQSVIHRRSFGADDDLAAAMVLADGVELVELRKRVRPGVSNLARHPRHLLDAWSMCETLRRLGFPSGDVAIGWGPVIGQGDDVVFANLTSGGVKMTICITRFPSDSASAALAGWEDLWNDVASSGEDDLSILLARSVMGEMPRIVSLVAELARQGIGIPSAPGKSGPLTLLVGPAVSLSQGGSS